MNFAERVRYKIETRRRAYLKSVEDSAEADERLRLRLEPLRAAVISMIEELSEFSVFVSAMGIPEVIIVRSDEDGREGILHLKGLSGVISLNVYEGHRVSINIDPLSSSSSTSSSLQSYGEGNNFCNFLNIDDLLDRVRDHLSDFLADISLRSETRPAAPVCVDTTERLMPLSG